MTETNRFKLLCVDDEPRVLAGLCVHLRRRHEVFTATSGAAGLAVLACERDVAVVVSDMRMPEMDGAAFLRAARDVAPDATRMLLTGQSDIHAAIAAVNEGQIFRFLSKPCLPSLLMSAVDAATAQHRLVIAERQLLEETLHGSIRMLTDVLALTNPAAFGRATRIKQIVSAILTQLGLQERWQLEVAAMLSQLGSIVLPPAAVEKLYYAQALTEDEQRMADRLPVVTQQLLANIPRLEVVRGILAAWSHQTSGTGTAFAEGDLELVVRGARILRIAADFDTLEGQGEPAAMAIEILRARRGRYDETLIDVLGQACGVRSRRGTVREVTLPEVQEGMVLGEDLMLVTGVLLATRGYEVTRGFVERARNFSQSVSRTRIRVIVSDDPPPAAG